SAQPPYLIRLRYAPRTKVDEKHIAIVGKGITFDSGGLSIKIGEGMYTMKSDMSGAAAVLAVMSVIRSLKIQRQVTAYIPTCENMVSDRSQKPGDIVKAINGKTIEVVNTDAEGRLILADALSLAVKDGADIIIDLATLTGACMVALGAKYAGLFSTSRELAKELIHAGEKAGERLWELPLAKEYEHQLKNTVADVRNISGTRWGGAVTAALFLKEFVGRTTWAHIDIAGPAFASADDLYIKKGGVGFGVRTLINWLSRE
ncbi:MAG: leucyl aminopeptidase, partial [Candidatus Dadabacteria bacterium]